MNTKQEDLRNQLRRPPARTAHSTARRLVAIAWIAVLLLLAGALVYEGRGIAASGSAASPDLTQPVPSATTYPPTGRRWFWEIPLWQQPESPDN